MIDLGLLVSIAVVVTIPALFVRPWPPDAIVGGVLDASLGAVAVGVVVARLTSLALDDPGSLTSLSDVLIIRSGVEFWAGAAVGLAWLAVGARKDKVASTVRIAALAPAALVAWAGYEATCLVRDGCPGPASVLGLRPDGLTTRVVPIGLLVALAATASAFWLGRLHRSGMPSTQVVLLTIATVAAIRSFASIWLPHIGDDLTRQHKESLAVLMLSLIGLTVLQLRHRSAVVDGAAPS